MLEHWGNHDGAILSEAFRMAGTSVLLRTDGATQSRVLLITSPHPQCGKTTSSANLAISLAEASKKVLIVDGDLRKSGLSHLFGFENSPGLREALSETWKDDPLKLIRPTDFRGVWVLPSGIGRENAAKLLQSDRLRFVIELLRADFDYVLLDAPPLLEFADARLLGKRAGGVILVCRAGRTKSNQLNEAWSVLTEDGANVLGTILNGYDLKTECPSRYSSYLGYVGTNS
jgi:receptor protein-tyrosine kinase